MPSRVPTYVNLDKVPSKVPLSVQKMKHYRHFYVREYEIK